MRKFKLIKEYPGCGSLGRIWEMYKGYLGDYHNQPEFWEEIIEKDYEILSFWNKEFKHLITQPFPGYTKNDYENNSSPWNIHSVKRLSDGEIFTIGDIILHKNDVTTKLGIIEKFHILSNKTLGKCNGLWFKTNNYNIPMCYVDHKFKQLSFITEDGVNIFKNDTFYHVDPYWQIGVGICDNVVFTKLKGYKEFSTKEKAQGYIYNNKPEYSLNDIKDAYFHKTGNSIVDLLDKLKQFKW